MEGLSLGQAEVMEIAWRKLKPW